MEKHRGKFLEFKVIDPRDSYLSDIQKTLSEWESKEDDDAFNDL
jgi:hypothetical protein